MNETTIQLHLGSALLKKLDEKIDRINRKLVYFRNLETEVRSVKKITDDLSKHLDDIEKFAQGTADCSFELVQKFIEKYCEYPEINIENHASIEPRKMDLEHFTSRVDFPLKDLKQTLPEFNITKWSPPLRLGGFTFKIGFTKTHSTELANWPMLNFHIRNLGEEGGSHFRTVKLGVMNPVSSKPHFEEQIDVNDCTSVIYSIDWALLFRKHLHWLDENGTLLVYCTTT